MKGFKVYELATTSSWVPVSCRRDFYRVYLLSGPHLLSRADPALPLHGGPCLCVGHPYPVGLVPGAGQPPGYKLPLKECHPSLESAYLMAPKGAVAVAEVGVPSPNGADGS